MQIDIRIKIIGVASKPDSILLKASDIKLILPKVKEADITGMVPTQALLLLCCLVIVWQQQLCIKENFQKKNLKYFIQVEILEVHYF